MFRWLKKQQPQNTKICYTSPEHRRDNNNDNNNRIERSKLRFFPQSPHCVAKCLQHLRSSGQGTMVCKPRATRQALITCSMSSATWYKGTAQLLSLTEFTSYPFWDHYKKYTVWRARAGSQETGPPLQTFQGHSEGRLAMVWHPTNWTGCYCSGQTALAHTFTICVICARGRASPSSTVRQRTPPLGSLYPSDKCELPVPRLRTALQVQDRPAEPLPYPQIRGTDNVILETEGPPWW